MNTLYRIFAFVLLAILGVSLNTEAQLSGTWYANGRADQPCTISQNGNNLVFTKGGASSNGYFSSTSTVFATQWNTSATLTTGNQGIIWLNQIWTRSVIAASVSLNGSWGMSAYPQENYTIEQDNIFLIITYQGKKIIGYFTGNNSIIVPEWNNTIANVSADGNTVTWSNQTWTKKGSTTTGGGTQTGSGISQKLCREELSAFYYASQSLGTAWGRMATEPSMMTADAVAACDAALFNLDATLGIIQCIVFDRNRIRNLRGKLATTSTSQLIPEIEGIIHDLEAVVHNLRMSCDNNTHIISLYVAGVNLGAAQAWASSRQCQPTPMPAAIATVITNHLTAASTALTAYASCIPKFDFSSFGRVNLASMNSILPHTQITGIETQLLWAVALSNCCCTCSPGQVTQSTNSGSACDDDCEKYCKSIGKQHGKYNGRTPCLLGVVSGGTNNGCDCY